MGLRDYLNGPKLRLENEKLKTLLTPELTEIWQQKAKIEELNQLISKLENQLESAELKLNKLNNTISEKKENIIELDDKLIYQDFGLYTPRFTFTNSDQYKDRLTEIRNNEKMLIKNNFAATGNMDWTVNGSSSKGIKMVKDMQKLLIRAFNSECDDAIDHVKYGNYEQSLKKITASKTAISKLGSIMNVAITEPYYNLKIDELSLALEYQIMKQKEKESLKAAREELREAAKLQKEIEEQRKKAEKEKSHYSKAYEQIIKKLESNPNDTDLIEKKDELELQLQKINDSIKSLDYREANQRAGYVYIISNIGSFGENVYKIGMTRRLEPQDRIDELGDASVPFNFDIHALIFTDDAPALENALHKAFENRKVNAVNPRREFFNVTLEEIKEVVKNNYDKTVEFIEVPDAEQYRQSLELRKNTF